MSLISTLIKPSGVSKAVNARLIPNDLNLVLVKEELLEIYSVRNGVELLYSLPVVGQIASLAAVPISKTVDWVVFSTYEGKIHIFRYNNGKFDSFDDTFVTNIGASSVSPYGHLVAVNSHYIALNVMQGYIKVFKIPSGASKKKASEQNLSELFSQMATVNLEFATPMDLKFVSKNVLAVLYSAERQCQVQYFSIQSNALQLTQLGQYATLPSPRFLVPYGDGLLAIGKSLHHLATPDKDLKPPPKPKVDMLMSFDQEMVAGCVIDAERVLFYASSGEVMLMEMSGSIEDMATKIRPDMHRFGKISPANSLFHISGNAFFAVGLDGNSTLFGVDLENQSIDIIHVLESLGPITDIEHYNDYGCHTIVVGAGGLHNGSLKRIKRGKLFNTEMEIDIGQPVHDMWGVDDDKLVLTAFGRTTVLEFSNGVNRLHEWEGIDMNVETLAVGKMDNGQIYQVTKTGVNNVLTANISIAAFHRGESLFLVTDKTKLTNHDQNLEVIVEREFDNEISRIAVHENQIAVAFWNSPRLVIMTRGFEPLHEFQLELDGLVRSLVYTKEKLIAGCSDGQIVAVKNYETVSPVVIQATCGPKPVSLFHYHDTAIAWSHYCFLPTFRRHDSVFDPAALDISLPNCAAQLGSKLVYATGTTICIGDIGDDAIVEKSIPVNGVVRRFLRINDDRFVILVIDENGGLIKLFDEKTESLLDEHVLPNHTPTSMVFIDSPDEFQGIVVGTSGEGRAQDAGQLLLLTIDENNQFHLQHKLSTDQQVIDVAFGGDYFTVPSIQLLVSVGQQVRIATIFRTDIEEDFQLKFFDLSNEFKSRSFTISLEAQDSTVVTGDLMRGVWLNQFEPGTAVHSKKCQLTPAAFMTSATAINGKTVCSSDINGRLCYRVLNDQMNGIKKGYDLKLPAKINCIKPTDRDLFNCEYAQARYLAASSNGGVYIISSIKKAELLYDAYQSEIGEYSGWMMGYAESRIESDQWSMLIELQPLIQNTGALSNTVKDIVPAISNSTSLLSPHGDGYW